MGGVKRRSGQRKENRLPIYDPRKTDAKLSIDLRAALKEKLSLAELVELEKQLRRADEEVRKKTMGETFRLTCFVFFRVLHDRFGFGDRRKASFWDAAKEYFDDVIAGRITPEEIGRTVEADGIRIEWGDYTGEAEKGE